MTQQNVERTIGKLATDEEFRTRFFANPAAATWEAGIALAPVELDALSALSQTALTRFSRALDPRISRLSLVGARPSAVRQRTTAERSDAGADEVMP